MPDPDVADTRAVRGWSDLASQEIQKRVEDWLHKEGGIAELERALVQADHEADEFRKSAAVDRCVLDQPMTV